MRPNMLPFFLLLFIISLFFGMGGVLLPVFVFFEIWVLCVSRENTLLWSLRKRQSAKDIISALRCEYGINATELHGRGMKNRFPNCILTACVAEKGPKYDQKIFDSMMQAWKTVCSKKMIWSELIVNTKSYRSRKSVKFSKAQKKVAKYFKDGFSIECETCILWIYPRFIIKETEQVFELIKWETVSCETDKLILLEQAKMINNPDNILPYAIKYQHANNDGSPDLRYKNNPSRPVYSFVPLTLKIGDEVRLLLLNNKDAQLITECMNTYIKKASKCVYTTGYNHTPSSYNPESIMNTIK